MYDLEEQTIEEINPFEIRDNKEELMKNLSTIDSRDLRSKFKNTQDPILLAFDSIDDTSLKTLAKDFVKETFYDFISFVGDMIK